MLLCRGIRGATTVDGNTAEAIVSATRELLLALVEANQIDPDQIASIIFTTTRDLNATFPAVAARQLGWVHVPLLCAHEMDVPGAPRGVVRVLMHVNTEKSPREIRHVYLRGARVLRPEFGQESVMLGEDRKGVGGTER
ncbi:chorismate mutase [Thermomicrobium sp. CFH 73360]|uniref:chorismate mutase n=1 Tax=Thermomicrobium roseum TaxID=500 RepID=A0A7C1K4R5_THERO|nr:chorismate mutase [Thermomicrobium sp. CFH 73360]MCM8745329.1 chorismate mutase [Thermomicrobium sp. CFH 73360]GBD20353.1 Chorismate mutase AroH [bacterium HR28]